MTSRIAQALQANDAPALAKLLHDQSGLTLSAEVLECLHVLAFGRSPIPCGGTVDQPWTDSTWMLWNKNRLEELSRSSGPKKLAEILERHNPTPPSDLRSWRLFLDRFNRELLECEDLDEIPPEARENRWVGFPPADDGAIAEAEHRLGRTLPPSLRVFYSISNGWITLGMWGCEILPVERIGWIRDLEPFLYQLAETAESTPGPFVNDPGDVRLLDYRVEQGTRVKRSLVVSRGGQYETLLLDPGAEPHGGEWPAGEWSSDEAMDWTCASFAELMNRLRKSFLDTRGDENG